MTREDCEKLALREEWVKRPYRITEKNICPEDSGETLMMYIPEYFNDYTQTWNKIHKCIKNKEKQYFFEFEEAFAACKAHAKKQPRVIWADLL